MKVLFVASEGLPFSKTGGLADVVEGLPKALVDLGHDVAVVLPYHRRFAAATEAPAPVAVAPSITIPIGTQLRFPSVLNTRRSGIDYFLVDDPGYFDRPSLYGDENGDFEDNPERFSELSRAAIEIAKQFWQPDVIHCHDWQAALVPVLLRTAYGDDPVMSRVPSVLTVHNLDYQGRFGPQALSRAGLPETLFHIDALEFYGDVNYLKGGLVYADYITTVSPRYSKEIQTPEYGAGLDGVLTNRADRLVGILNGVDYSEWDPATDKLIHTPYHRDDISGKRACKSDLLQTSGLTTSGPVIGIVSRLADHKGFDLITKIIGDVVKTGASVVVLGKGDGDEGVRIENELLTMARALPNLSVTIARDNELAHKIEAGADMFMMPSRTEPCGLNQMYSLRYGTVPIVRATGGLDDSVEAYDPITGKGTGFKFVDYTAAALLTCVRQALRLYENDAQAWRQLQDSGMVKDFSWHRSAQHYVEVYECALASASRRAGDRVGP
jgi:starch synthase